MLYMNVMELLPLQEFGVISNTRLISVCQQVGEYSCLRQMKQRHWIPKYSVATHTIVNM